MDKIIIALFFGLIMLAVYHIEANVAEKRQAYKAWCYSNPGNVFTERPRLDWECWTQDGRRVFRDIDK